MDGVAGRDFTDLRIVRRVERGLSVDGEEERVFGRVERGRGIKHG